MFCVSFNNLIVLTVLLMESTHCYACIVLNCIVLYCIVLYCIVLYCIVLYCIVLYCIVLYCIVLYCIVLYWTDLDRGRMDMPRHFHVVFDVRVLDLNLSIFARATNSPVFI